MTDARPPQHRCIVSQPSLMLFTRRHPELVAPQQHLARHSRYQNYRSSRDPQQTRNTTSHNIEDKIIRDLRIKLAPNRRDMPRTKAPNPDRRRFLLSGLAASAATAL